MSVTTRIDTFEGQDYNIYTLPNTTEVNLLCWALDINAILDLLSISKEKNWIKQMIRISQKSSSVKKELATMKSELSLDAIIDVNTCFGILFVLERLFLGEEQKTIHAFVLHLENYLLGQDNTRVGEIFSVGVTEFAEQMGILFNKTYTGWPSEIFDAILVDVAATLVYSREELSFDISDNVDYNTVPMPQNFDGIFRLLSENRSATSLKEESLLKRRDFYKNTHSIYIEARNSLFKDKCLDLLFDGPLAAINMSIILDNVKVQGTTTKSWVPSTAVNYTFKLNGRKTDLTSADYQETFVTNAFTGLGSTTLLTLDLSFAGVFFSETASTTLLNFIGDATSLTSLKLDMSYCNISGSIGTFLTDLVLLDLLDFKFNASFVTSQNLTDFVTSLSIIPLKTLSLQFNDNEQTTSTWLGALGTWIRASDTIEKINLEIPYDDTTWVDTFYTNIGEERKDQNDDPILMQLTEFTIIQQYATPTQWNLMKTFFDRCKTTLLKLYFTLAKDIINPTTVDSGNLGTALMKLNQIIDLNLQLPSPDKDAAAILRGIRPGLVSLNINFTDCEFDTTASSRLATVLGSTVLTSVKIDFSNSTISDIDGFKAACELFSSRDLVLYSLNFKNVVTDTSFLATLATTLSNKPNLGELELRLGELTVGDETIDADNITLLINAIVNSRPTLDSFTFENDKNAMVLADLIVPILYPPEPSTNIELKWTKLTLIANKTNDMFSYATYPMMSPSTLKEVKVFSIDAPGSDYIYGFFTADQAVLTSLTLNTNMNHRQGIVDVAFPTFPLLKELNLTLIYGGPDPESYQWTSFFYLRRLSLKFKLITGGLTYINPLPDITRMAKLYYLEELNLDFSEYQLEAGVLQDILYAARGASLIGKNFNSLTLDISNNLNISTTEILNAFNGLQNEKTLRYIKLILTGIPDLSTITTEIENFKTTIKASQGFTPIVIV